MSLDWILFTLFVFCSFIQIIIWVYFPGKFLFFIKEQSKKKTFTPAVSVIICARNEAENLRKNLPAVLEQEYSGQLEVVVVDDASTDSTTYELDTLSAKYPTLKTIRINEKIHPGKKQALALGVANASHDWIVVTDADCRPISKRWIEELLIVPEKNGIVLGYAPLLNNNGWFNKWTRYETLITALQYFSLINIGWAFMGVGRNMAWHRSAFERLTKSQLNWNIPGGDDDLLVNKSGRHFPVYWTIDPNSFVYSPAKATIDEWIRQKQRHLSSGLSYRLFHRLLLGGQAFTHSGHYGFALLLWIINPEFGVIIGLLYTLRIGVIYLIIKKACTVFKERGLLNWTILLDGLMAIWVGLLAPLLLVLGPKKTW